MPDLTKILFDYKLQIAGNLVLAGIGGVIVYFNIRKNRRADAAEKFRSVFLAKLKGLYPTPTQWPQDFNVLNNRLREAFVSLQPAVDEFKRFVPLYRRKRFNMAWRQYRLGKEGLDAEQQNYKHYQSSKGAVAVTDSEFPEITDGQERFKQNVDQLLSFAKRKTPNKIVGYRSM